MKNKSNRLESIKNLISNNKISGQTELLNKLQEMGFDLTQATLSRDMKQLKIAKMPDIDGKYIYIMPEDPESKTQENSNAKEIKYNAKGFISLDFCGAFAVIKTKPGYSGGIAAEIDSAKSSKIIGTIAGDDTILIIPREETSKEELLYELRNVIPPIKK